MATIDHPVYGRCSVLDRTATDRGGLIQIQTATDELFWIRDKELVRPRKSRKKRPAETPPCPDVNNPDFDGLLCTELDENRVPAVTGLLDPVPIETEFERDDLAAMTTTEV